MGWSVAAFDISAAGRDKALQLAARHGVHIDYQVADYETARIDTGSYDAVALIFAHIHESSRRSDHRKLASALAPGGTVILEAYSKEQLGYGTGGPPAEPLLYAVDELREDFAELEILQLEKNEAEIHEGQYHTGLASVIRLVARRKQSNDADKSDRQR